MRSLFLATILLFACSCSLLRSDDFKEKTISAVVKVVKPMSVKILGCRTGDPIGNDLGLRLEKLLKVGEKDQIEKGLVGDVCTYAVNLALPFLVNLGDEKLPASWVADGCSLKKVGDSVGGLAGMLCGMIPI